MSSSAVAASRNVAWQAARARAMALLRVGQDVAKLSQRDGPPDEPRDETGKWTSGGGSGSGSAGEAEKPGEPEKPKPNPEVLKVGGDEWNKKTAERLEHEYVEAYPALDKIAHEAVGSESEPPEADEEDDQPFVPDEWASMTNDQQEQAESAYMEQTYQSYLDSEIENWQSERAPDDARAQTAYEFTEGKETEWAKDALAEYLDQRKEDGEPPIPYSDEALLNALTITHDTGNYPISKGTDIEIDDAKLEPDLAANQPSLPGMEGVGVIALTPETKASIIEVISAAFEKRSDYVLDHLEPPEYLSDSVKEYQSDSWSQMDDGSKFEWVKNNTDIIEDAEKTFEAAVELDRLPAKFDPLQQGASAKDYKRTQLLARQMSVDRAAQVLIKRGLVKTDKEVADFVNKEEYDKYLTSFARDYITKIDRGLWYGWKGSSTNDQGQLLQVATAEELGGRLYEHRDINRDSVIARADRQYADIGGFDGIKAYVRGKWETSQYLLHEAGIHTLNLYRAINVQPPPTFTVIAKDVNTWAVIADGGFMREFATKEKAEAYRAQQEAENPPDRVEEVTDDRGLHYEKLPDLAVKRNGAASTSTDPNVSNKWDGTAGRVVLRAEVPRTAVVSVPAYGINVQSEHEVVVAGTAWRAWDAWKGRAPEFDYVPLRTGQGIAA